MNDLKEYVEELFLYAPGGQTKIISNALQKEFAQLEPNLLIQAVSNDLLEEDEMGLRDYWLQRFGESIDPESHVLSRVVFRFISDSSMELDELSMLVYKIVSKIIGQVDGIEYFSSFGEAEDAESA